MKLDPAPVQAFLMSMRREWMKIHPDKPCPIKNLSDYPMAERNALARSIYAAIEAGKVKK